MSVSAPYPRFRFAFVDDVPGANWAHPRSCVFVSEVMSCFVFVSGGANAKANGLRFWYETFAVTVKIDEANIVTDVTLDYNGGEG